MISANKNGPKPRFWDVPSHRLQRLKVETFSKFKASKSEFVKDLGLKKRFITSVAISQCGNFGLSGYNDGYLLKSIMQTGEHSTTFWNKNIHQNKPIIGLFSDSLNHFMITSDDTAVGRWDFFSGRFKDQVVIPDGIQSMFGHHNSYLFAVVDKANVIHVRIYLWDPYRPSSSISISSKKSENSGARNQRSMTAPFWLTTASSSLQIQTASLKSGIFSVSSLFSLSNCPKKSRASL